MAWNGPAFEVLGGAAARTDGAELAALERWIGGGLPAAVREWFALAT